MRKWFSAHNLRGAKSSRCFACDGTDNRTLPLFTEDELVSTRWVRGHTLGWFADGAIYVGHASIVHPEQGSRWSRALEVLYAAMERNACHISDSMKLPQARTVTLGRRLNRHQPPGSLYEVINVINFVEGTTRYHQGFTITLFAIIDEWLHERIPPLKKGNGMGSRGKTGRAQNLRSADLTFQRHLDYARTPRPTLKIHAAASAASTKVEASTSQLPVGATSATP